MAAPAPLKSKAPVIGPALIPLGHHQGKPAIPLLRPVIVIGSRSSARIHLVSHTVSKAHALLIRSRGRSYIRDLASRTRLLINEDETREADLDDGDILKIGSFVFKYVASNDEKTLPRLTQPVSDAPPCTLEIPGLDFPFPIDQRVILIGRRSACDLHLLEDSVSTAHAVIFEMNGERFIRDLGSRTGTFVNGVSTHQHQLVPGDRIKIGETELRYLPSESAQTAVVDEPEQSHEAFIDHAVASVAVEPVRPAPVAERPEIAAPLVPPAAPAQPRGASELDLAPLDLELQAPVVSEQVAPSNEPRLELPSQPMAPPADAPIEDEPVLAAEAAGERVEPQATDAPAASADIDAPAPALSAASESSSAVETKPDKLDELALEVLASDEPAPAKPSEPATPEPEAHEAALPRRGWRGLGESLALTPSDAPPGATEEVSQPSAEPVLKFPDSISHSDAAAGDTAAAPDTAVLDSEALAAEALPASASTELHPADLGLDAEALNELIPPASSQPEHSPASEPRAGLDLSRLEQPAEPPIEPPVTEQSIEPVEPIEPVLASTSDAASAPSLESLAAESAAPIEPVIEPIVEPPAPIEQVSESAAPIEPILQRTVEEPAPIQPLADEPAPSGPIIDTDASNKASLDLSMDAPLAPQDAASIELPEVESPTPAEDSARPLIASVELPDAPAEPLVESEPIKTAAIRLRKPRRPRKTGEKPETIDPLPALEAPVERLVDEPESATPIAESVPPAPVEIVIEPTEPTNESALQESADQLALDALAAPDAPPVPAVDELTDTTFERSVREFAGSEIGEIIEEGAPAPATEINLTETGAAPAAETPAPELGDELTVPEPPMPDTVSAPELQAPSIDQAVPEAPIADVSVPDLEVAEPVESSVGEAPIGEVEVPQLQPDEPADAPVVEAPIADTFVADELPTEQLDQPVASVPIAEATPPVDEAPLDAADVTAKASPTEPTPPHIPWGANQDNFLGGVPLNLKSPTPPSHSDTPIGDKAVKELIEEIDSVAAKAEATGAKPANDPPAMGIIPPRPRRAGVFRGAARRRADEISAPPLASDAPADAPGKLTTSFDALADSPLREMDVFSQMSPPGSDEADEDAEAVAQDEQPVSEPAQSAPPRRPRGTITGAFGAPAVVESAVGAGVATQEIAADSELGRRQKVIPELSATAGGMVIGARRPAVTYAADLTEAEARAIRKRYLRRVYALLIVMVALVIGVGYGVYNYYGVQTTVEAAIKFNNLSLLNQRDRLIKQTNQLRVLRDDATRRLATAELKRNFPQIAPSFLADHTDYVRKMDRAGFSDANPDVLNITLEGTDGEDNRQRLAAIAEAMFTQNQVLVIEAADARKAAEQIRRAVADYNRQLELINAEIEKLRILGQSAPSREQIKQLESEAAALEQKWNEAVAAVKAVEAELERMKSEPLTDSGATTAPAINPADDPKIKHMQAELDALLAKVNEGKAASSAQATTARQILDSALDAFQKQVADAQGMMSDNPELAAFIQSAQTLLERTRTHTEGLINRQQQQFARLTELQTRMNEQMEQRRIEIWKKDEKIQEYRARHDIVERQYNAAVGGGMEKEADEKKAEMDLIKNMIKAREEDLPVDNFYKEAIQQLQVIVDSTRKDIEEDRAKTEQLLTTLQQSFTSKQTIEKLPAEQKQLAAELQLKLETINAARKQYNQAIDSSAADVDERLKTQVTALQTAIETRRKELADENVKNLAGQQEQTRLANIEEKQAELDKLKLAQNQAQQAYFEKHKQLRATTARIDDARENSEKLDSLLLQRDPVQRNLETNLAQQDARERAARQAVEPVKPDIARDIASRAGTDRRLLYTLISCGSIFALFTLLIMWTLHTAWVEAPIRIKAADLTPVNNGKPNGSDEDHQPATV